MSEPHIAVEPSGRQASYDHVHTTEYSPGQVCNNFASMIVFSFLFSNHWTLEDQSSMSCSISIFVGAVMTKYLHEKIFTVRHFCQIFMIIRYGLPYIQ